MRTRSLSDAIAMALDTPVLPPLARTQYERILPGHRPDLRFRLQPGLTLIERGRIAVRRRRGSVVVEWLPPGPFALLVALSRGAPLSEGAEAAAAADAAFDVVGAIERLLDEGLVVSVGAAAGLRAA